MFVQVICLLHSHPLLENVNMKSWSIARKLSASLLILVSLSLSILFVFALEMRTQSEKTQNAIDNNVSPLIDVANALNAMQRARINLRDALFATQSNAPEDRIKYYRNTYTKLAELSSSSAMNISKQPMN